MELETDQQIPFLDMLIERRENKLSTAWYSKPTDTGVYLSYHACAPTKHKRNIEEGAVHRIHHTTSSWLAFHSGLETLAKRLEANQYPPNFYGPIIRDTVTKIIGLQPSETTPQIKSDSHSSRNIFTTQYRGRISDLLGKKLRQTTGCSVVFNTRKLKTVLPSLKSPITKELRSSVVYKISCSGCNSCYVGQTVRHLQTRLSEHLRAPVGGHFDSCEGSEKWTVDILATCNNSIKLLTLEAPHIANEKPSLNTREEYRQRPLTIRF